MFGFPRTLTYYSRFTHASVINSARRLLLGNLKIVKAFLGFKFYPLTPNSSKHLYGCMGIWLSGDKCMQALKVPKGWVGGCRGYSCKQHRENNGDCDNCPIDASD